MKRYSIFSVRLVVMTCLLAGGRPLWGAEALPEDRLAGDLRRAWELLEAGDAEATVEFADNTLSGISKEALAEAGKMGGFSPKGEEYTYNQVNVAGTLTYVKALAWQRAGKREEWLAALRAVWTDYPFCQAWDPQGWFWKPGQAAKKEGYLEVISGAIRDRRLAKSPFPGKEDALDYPQMSIALASAVSQALERADYAGLEFLAGRMQEMDLRYPDGGVALPVFFTAAGGAAGPGSKDASWELTGERLGAWRKAFPESVIPRIAEAHRLIQWGWEVRGSGFADKVKPEAWPKFQERLKEARAELEACPRTCPEWYEERLTICRALSEPVEELNAIFKEGWKKFPGYTQMLDGMTVAQLPRWGGKAGDYVRFAKHMEASAGAGMYAAVMLVAWNYERDSMLEEKGFDRELFHRSCRAMLDAHAGSLSLIHRYLIMGISLKDDELCRECYRRAGERYHPEFWQNVSDYLAYRKAQQ